MIDMVNEIVNNVRNGIRTKKDLKICGCENCRKALMVLENKNVDINGELKTMMQFLKEKD